MSQPAVKQEQVSANDSDLSRAVGEKEVSKEGKASSQVQASASNSVKRAVEEFKELIDEMDDIREVLRAHGVPLRTTRMIVEFGIHNKADRQSAAMDSAMENVVKSMGEGCLERRVLENHIATIVTLERDLVHARSAARDEGLDAGALSMLTQMVQQNPGDNGEKAVNTFLGYALAYGVKTDQLTAIAGELVRQPVSVLPQIPRKADTKAVKPGKKLLQDLLVGLLIGCFVIYALV